MSRDSDGSALPTLAPNLITNQNTRSFHSFLKLSLCAFALCSAALSWASEKGLDTQLVHENEALYNLRGAIAAEREVGGAVVFEDMKKWSANVVDISNISR